MQTAFGLVVAGNINVRQQQSTQQVTTRCTSILQGGDLTGKFRKEEDTCSKETQGHTTVCKELLTKCQCEFEKDKKDDKGQQKLLEAINEAKTVEEKHTEKDELEIWQSKARSWSLGNISFVG